MPLRDQQARPRERSYSDYTSPSHNTPSGTATADSKMATTKKHRQRGRPRSKSCDRHRRSPTHVHKKKCCPKRHIQHHIHGRVSPGRSSPKSSLSSSSCQELCGKLWVRPVAVRRKSASVAPQAEARDNHDHTFAPMFPNEDPLVQCVKDSPVYDDELMWFTSSNSSFDSFQLQRQGTNSPKNMRVVFGESGKPIRPRNF